MNFYKSGEKVGKNWIWINIYRQRGNIIQLTSLETHWLILTPTNILILLTDWDTSKPLSNKFCSPSLPTQKRKHSQALTFWDLMTRLIDLLSRQISRKQKGLEIKPHRFQLINWNQAMNRATLINWGRSQALVLSLQKPRQQHFNRFSSNESIFAWSNLCTQYFNLGSLQFHTFIHIN